ncbi:MAG TPA: DUF3592 domain-containing protein [Microlunatus sp.]|nr:DUF3592 domain-containing protein [Microlunatus sp.]
MRWLRFPRLLGLIVCVYLLALAALFGYLSVQNYGFVHRAAQTTGTVISLDPRPPAGSTRTPRAETRAPTVRYVVEGRAYTYTAAHGTYRQRHRVGDTMEVLYDPTNPGRARLRGEGRLMIPLIASGFATAALLLGFVLFRTRDVGADRPSP